MKKILLPALLTLISLVVAMNSNAQDWQWAGHVSGTSDMENITGMALDASGNVYVTGTFGSGAAINGTSLTTAGAEDIFIAKYDNSGVLKWVRTGGSDIQDLSRTLEVDGTGNVYVTGFFRNTANFDSLALDDRGSRNLVSDDGKRDIFIVKYNTIGQLRWARRVAWATGNDVPEGLNLGAGNNIYISGTFKDSLMFTSEKLKPLNPGNQGGFIAKYNNDGDFIWAKQTIHTDSDTKFLNISATVNDQIYLVGYFTDTIVVEGDTILTQNPTSGTQDAILMKINNGGDVQWIRKAGGLGSDRGNSVFADIYGDVYITGYFTGTANFDSSGFDLYNSQDFVSAGGLDMYIAKYNSQGTLQWVGVNGSTGEDIGYGLYANDEVALLSGSISNTVIFGNDTLISTGEETGFFVFDNQGAPIFGESIAGDLEDRGQGLVYDESLTQTTITGYFKSTSLAVPPLASITNASAGTKDGFVAAFDNPVSVSFVEKTNVACYGDNTGRLVAETFFGAEPITYEWSHDGGLNDPVAENLYAGDYTLIVIDNTGARDTAVTTITQQTPMQIGRAITDVTCYGSQDGAIDITPSGGVPGYTYFWELATKGLVTTSQDQTGLFADDYKVTVTDSYGCELDSIFTVGSPAQLLIDSISKGDVSIKDAGDGWAKVYVSGGTQPYDYDWSNGGSTDSIGGLDGGLYSVDVTDDHECVASGINEVVISEDSLLIVDLVKIQDITCYGDSDGSVRAIASGGIRSYSYEFTGGTVIDDTIVINLGPGKIKVTVTDDHGAKAYDSLQIIEPALLSIGKNITDVTCFGDDDGGIVVDISGGTAPYTSHWSNGATTQNLTSVSQGYYCDTVTDAHGCKAITCGLVDEPDSMEFSFVVTDAICYGQANGSAEVFVESDSVGPYSYYWSNTFTSKKIDLVYAGKYWVRVTDGNGCQNSDTVEIGEPDSMEAVAAEIKPACAGRTDGAAAVVSVTNGTGPFTFLWDDLTNKTDSVATDLDPGRYYIVEVTDVFGCTDTGRTYVNEQAVITITLDSTRNVYCEGYDSGAIYISHDAAAAPFTFSWSPGNYDTEDLVDVPAGDYELELTDANGCKNILPAFPFEATIQDLSTPINIYAQYADPQLLDCFGDSDGTIVLAANGPYEYSINDGAAFQIDTLFESLPAGEYITVVRDGNGCLKWGDTLMIAQPGQLVFDSIAIDSAASETWPNGAVRVYVSGGTAPYEYYYNGILSNDTLTDLPPGSDTIYVRDANACQTADSIIVINATGIGNIFGYREAVIYPNPNTGRFTIELENAKGEDIDLQVISLLGQVVHREIFRNNSTGRFERTIELGKQARGAYFIRINGLPVNAKLMIE